ncbi:LytTR family DNA-binding domain-containing protein [uncultured Croceitalea sp.]|uniref:LytR/AlgR family response regulator transcription factor n=1 Tax=uncultured Croceitalea sp. TaxID=1798908 RepID=UPI0033058F48
MKKLSCIIIDDEKTPREWLAITLKKSFPNTFVAGVASSLATGLELIKTTKPDIIFLDIELGDGTGFDLLRELVEYSFDVIFTTSHEKYALNAIRVSALDYLIKPLDISDLERCIKKIEANRKTKRGSHHLEILNENLGRGISQENKIALASMSGFDFVKISDIIYCQSDVNYTIFKTISKEIMVSKSLKTYDELLSDYNFFRIHQSYLINMTHLEKYHRGKTPVVIMSNKDHLNVSRNKKEKFLNFLKAIS